LSKALDAAFEGTWAVSFGMDYISGLLQEVYTSTEASYNFGRVGVQQRGTHYKVRGVESGTGYARFSNVAVHFEGAESR
jgi:hypothetical protein